MAIWPLSPRPAHEGAVKGGMMRRVCTVTGKCPEKFPCVKNADGTLYSEPRPCPYYTRTGTAEVIDWRERYGELERLHRALLLEDCTSCPEVLTLEEGLDYLASRFEELAGRYLEQRRDLEEVGARFNGRPFEERIVVTEDQVSVRPYVRSKPRRSKPVETGAVPSEDTTTAPASDSGASGEVTVPSMCLSCRVNPFMQADVCLERRCEAPTYQGFDPTEERSE